MIDCAFWLPHKNHCRGLSGKCPGKLKCHFYQSYEERIKRNARYGESDKWNKDQQDILTYNKILKGMHKHGKR